jgi:hypothetical protein
MGARKVTFTDTITGKWSLGTANYTYTQLLSQLVG